jgi:hypothetical protein
LYRIYVLESYTIMSTNIQSVTRYSGTNNKIIVSFSGRGLGMGLIPQFEFVNFLEKHYSNYERLFLLDIKSKWYFKGIDGISTNIDETLTYLKEIIRDFEEVIFIGSSSGGYAAILFGSLLNVDRIIAFRPQTIITPNEYLTSEDIDSSYSDLKPFINTTTKYFIYGDPDIKLEIDPLHHVFHCERINIYPNVVVNTDYRISVRVLRDKGILQQIMSSAILGEQSEP